MAALLAGLLFSLGFQHVRSRDILARAVSERPQLVFWAHPTVVPAQNCWLFAHTKLQFLMLHLRTGQQFEAGLLPQEVDAFVKWLTTHNPSVRIGAYDDGGLRDMPK